MHRKKWGVLFGMGLMIFLLNVDATVMNVALVTLAHYFALRMNLAQWVITIYLLVAALVLIPAGRVADITSRRDVYLIGVVLFFLGSCLGALAGNIVWLLIGRALQGMGYGMSMALITVLATMYFPEEQKGRALGTLAILSCLGLAVGPTLGGAIAQFLSWRVIFWMNVPVCLLSILIVLWICPREKQSLQSIEAFNWQLIRSLFDRRAYLILVVNRFLFMAAYGVMLLIVPLYLQNFKNFSPLITGTLMLGMTLAVILGSTGFARWLDQKGYRVFHRSACALLFVGYLFFVIAFAGGGLGTLIPGLIFAGLATGLYFIGSVRGALQEVPDAHQGLGMSFFYASALLGGAFWGESSQSYFAFQCGHELASLAWNEGALYSVGSGIQSFYQQDWAGSTMTLPALHATLMQVFQHGLLVVAVLSAGFAFLATYLAWRLTHDD